MFTNRNRNVDFKYNSFFKKKMRKEIIRKIMQERTYNQKILKYIFVDKANYIISGLTFKSIKSLTV